MKIMVQGKASLFLYFIFMLLTSCKAALIPATDLPLRAESRWIVNKKGYRVKLRCLNWAAHLETRVAEGLHKQPLNATSAKIVSHGFNCVRLTWALDMVINQTLASLTVNQSFHYLGITEAVAGVQANNPDFLNRTVMDALMAVVENLAENGLVIILDNHVTQAQWCCKNKREGFFTDPEFNPNGWLKGLSHIAALFNKTKNVVGFSLRNNLRGKYQSVNIWYQYMQICAALVHSVNPDSLVILSGLDYESRLSFLREQIYPCEDFRNKIVFEFQWYAFSDFSIWVQTNPNTACRHVIDRIMDGSGFLLEQGRPLFLSEFGVDMRGRNVNDNRFFNCFLTLVAELDLDWALWSVMGSYYYREGMVDVDETYGFLDSNWEGLRNESFFQRIIPIYNPFQGPGLYETTLHSVILYPLKSLCVLKGSMTTSLHLGQCALSEAWTYKNNMIIHQPSGSCLQATRMDHPVLLEPSDSRPCSIWSMVSDSRLHLACKLSNGASACLDVDSQDMLVAKECFCLEGNSTCDPARQWFKFVNSTRSIQRIPVA